ncbi:hypothetical protein J2125_004220 [Erwinia toletana]|uniref:Uncharacterized protein n=1 Tax=Winslowiella toletana TaxID=92490 RepID=A0ABS4PGJ6_9GAMM|nr:hypothetical protein [Winslowiella toletana]MBP2171028.1 hypothetical protein [Winslowiella toletana]
MIQHTLTLRLSWGVSDILLQDLRALLPAAAIQFFSNELDERWHYTLLCMQGGEHCSLIVSVIIVWRQLGRITSMQYSNPDCTRDISAASQKEMFALLKIPGAVLHIS